MYSSNYCVFGAGTFFLWYKPLASVDTEHPASLLLFYGSFVHFALKCVHPWHMKTISFLSGVTALCSYSVYTCILLFEQMNVGISHMKP